MTVISVAATLIVVFARRCKRENVCKWNEAEAQDANDCDNPHPAVHPRPIA